MLASFIQYEVHLALAHDFADGSLGRLTHVLIRRAVVEQIIGRIFQEILHGELNIDDIFVIGQHQRFFQHFVLHVLAVTDFHGTDLTQADNLNGFDRIRKMPARTRLGRLDIFTKTQHDTALTGIHNVETTRHPDQCNDDNDQPDTTGKPAGRLTAARIVRCAAAQLGKQSFDFLV